MTHHLLCLALPSLTPFQFTIAQTYSGMKSGHPIPDDHHWHMIHCMDYMREAILCSADMALEGHETTFPDDNGGSDGWDSKHGESFRPTAGEEVPLLTRPRPVCKDYTQVKTYLESVRAYDDQLIY